jgi:hypothetical protein
LFFGSVNDTAKVRLFLQSTKRILENRKKAVGFAQNPAPFARNPPPFWRNPPRYAEVSVQVSVPASKGWPILRFRLIPDVIFHYIIVICTLYPTLPTLPTPKKVQQVQEVSEV